MGLDDLIGRVHCSDALELMRRIPDASVDAIVSDPPYNMTELDFDKHLVNWQAFWVETARILKTDYSPTVLFSQQPFTTDLIMSNRKFWRYELIWEKTMPVGFLDANRRPLRTHENIQIFANKMPIYYPQMERSNQFRAGTSRSGAADHYNKHVRNGRYEDNGSRYPRSVWKYAQRDTAFENTETLHPTQKPQGLIEKLLLTYTLPDMLILDPFAGSGTTAAACQALNRRWIAGDSSPEYCAVMEKRLKYYTPNMFEVLS